MKKTTKKLALHKETLKQINQGELLRIRGGTFTNPPFCFEPRPSGACNTDTLPNTRSNLNNFCR